MTTVLPQIILDKAYLKQKKYVAQKAPQLGIAGYKAAVSSKQGQQNMGLSTLLSGVLYAKGELANNSTITKKDFQLPRIETEIGYILSKDITELTTSSTVKNMIDAMLPVFEIPDVIADDPSNIDVSELLAKNTFSSHFVVGKRLDVNSIDPNTCVAKLYYNKALIGTGYGTDAMDDQWEALSVAINLAIKHGYNPKKGDLIITGALGQVFDIEKGIYTADFGDLGQLSLTVK